MPRVHLFSPQIISSWARQTNTWPANSVPKTNHFLLGRRRGDRGGTTCFRSSLPFLILSARFLLASRNCTMRWSWVWSLIEMGEIYQNHQPCLMLEDMSSLLTWPLPHTMQFLSRKVTPGLWAKGLIHFVLSAHSLRRRKWIQPTADCGWRLESVTCQCNS